MCDPTPGFVVSQDFLNFLLNQADEAQVCSETVQPTLVLPQYEEMPQTANDSAGFWYGFGAGAGAGAGLALIAVVAVILAGSE